MLTTPILWKNQIVEIVHDVMYPNFAMEELSQRKK